MPAGAVVWGAGRIFARVTPTPNPGPLAAPSAGRPRARSLHRFANPGQFLRLSARLLPWLTAAGLVLTLAGITLGLLAVPPDYQQGDAVKIMFIHVPSAWLSSAGYASLALASAMALIWRHPLADLAAAEIAPVGAWITALCLITGSLWGRPTWGTYWVWDGRLTSVLVLFFLYCGHILLVRAFDDPQRGYRAGAILALIGALDLPVIKFSVEWWNTLHQKASITLGSAPSMAPAMLWPLLLCALGFTFGFAAILTARLRAAVMESRVRALLSAQAAQSA